MKRPQRNYRLAQEIIHRAIQLHYMYIVYVVLSTENIHISNLSIQTELKISSNLAIPSQCKDNTWYVNHRLCILEWEQWTKYTINANMKK